MSTPTSVNLGISPLVGKLIPARGFYQLEEEVLFVQVGHFESGERFFSSLECKNLRLECDQRGRLIFIESTTPRRLWEERPGLELPLKSEASDVRFLDFRTTIIEPKIQCDHSRKLVCLRFTNEITQSVRLGERLVLDIGVGNKLAAIWISNIVDDKAGRKIAAFRRSLSS